MGRQRRRFIPLPAAQGARNGGDHAAPHGAGRHLGKQQRERQHHRPARQSRLALPRRKPWLDQLRDYLRCRQQAGWRREGEDLAQPLRAPSHGKAAESRLKSLSPCPIGAPKNPAGKGDSGFSTDFFGAALHRTCVSSPFSLPYLVLE